MLTVGAPLAVSGLLLTHPPGTGEALRPFAAYYMVLHVILLFGFPLVGIAGILLLRDVGGLIAGLARGTFVVFAIAYGAYDALAGISTSALLLGPEGNPTSLGHPIVGEVMRAGRVAFFLACSLAALALVRAGRGVVAVLPLIGAGLLLIRFDHVPPAGFLPFLAFGLGALALEVDDLRPRRRPT